MIMLSPIQLDAIKEVGTMGSAHAITNLSVLLQTRVELLVPKVQLLPLEQVPEFLGGAEIIVAAVYIELIGEIKGSILMIFPKKNAETLVNLMLTKKKPAERDFDAYEESIIKEIGNISACAYLNVIANLTDFKISCSVPFLAVDMLGAVLNQVLAENAKETDQALIIETEFMINECKANGFFLFLPNLAGLQKILAKLEV